MANVQQPRRRNLELLLAEDVPHVGSQGDIVTVKPGFARNYLLPQGLATIASDHNKRMVEKHRERLADQQKQKIQQLRTLGEQVGKYSVTIEAHANEEGHLYGSIVGSDISKALKNAGYAVEPDHVRLDGPLKELAMYTVKVQLHPEVETEVKVWVVPAAKG